MINRREMIHGVAAGVGVPFGLGLLPGVARTEDQASGGPRRIVFFLQNHGFDPLTCIPKGLDESCSLDGVTLEKPMQALESYKDRMHVITGLHGRHTSPGHSAYFGALGGYRGSQGVPPAGATIDYVLSQSLPRTILPPLCIGMESMESMKARPTIATLTASGAGRTIFMHSDPNNLYEMLFGSVADGDVKRRHQGQRALWRE
jgi:hypothetical protein